MSAHNHAWCKGCRPDITTAPGEYKVKSCGKSHAHCRECNPEVGRAIGLTRMEIGFRVPLEEALVLGHQIHGQNTRSRLVEAGIWEDRCTKCGVGPEWEDEPLALQVDHKDGNVFNSVLENLRLLCPNCHSQTETYAAKNRTYKREMASPDVSP